MSIITTHIDGEELKVLKGFKLSENEVIISDADQLGDLEPIRVVIEPSLIKYWIEERGLLKEVGVEGTIW